MKRIKLKTLLAGPAGAKHPGEHVVTDEEAEALVDAGCAEILGEPEEAPVDLSKTSKFCTACNGLFNGAVTECPGCGNATFHHDVRRAAANPRYETTVDDEDVEKTVQDKPRPRKNVPIRRRRR